MTDVSRAQERMKHALPLLLHAKLLQMALLRKLDLVSQTHLLCLGLFEGDALVAAEPLQLQIAVFVASQLIVVDLSLQTR